MYALEVSKVNYFWIVLHHIWPIKLKNIYLFSVKTTLSCKKTILGRLRHIWPFQIFKFPTYPISYYPVYGCPVCVFLGSKQSNLHLDCFTPYMAISNFMLIRYCITPYMAVQ